MSAGANSGGFTFLGLTNILGRSATSVSALFDEVVDLEGRYLKSEEPSDIARIPTLNPTRSFWKIGLGYTLNRFDGFAAVNSKLSPDGLWRVVGSSQVDGAIRINVPTSIAASTNITGGVTNIDENLASPGPDGNYIVPTVVTSDWSVTLNIPTTGTVSGSDLVLAGSNRSIFILYVKLFEQFSEPVSSVALYPKITVKLKQSGVVIRELGHRAVTETNSQYLLFSFDIAETDNSGSVQCEISQSVGLNGNGNALFFGLDAVNLLTEAVDFDFDTGWMSNEAHVWSYPSDGPKANPILQKFLNAPVQLTSLALWYQDDQTIHDPNTSGDETTPAPVTSGVPAALISTFPKSYIDTGVLLGGPKLTLTNGLRVNNSFAPRTMQVDGQSITGQTYGADAFRQLIGPPVELTVTREEGLIILDRVGMRRGKSGAFFVAHDPSLPAAYQVFSSAYVTCAEIGGMEPIQPQQYTADNQMLFTIRLRFEEKL